MTESESLELAVISAAMYSKEAARSRILLNDSKVRNEEKTDTWKLVVSVMGEDKPISLKYVRSSFDEGCAFV